MKLVWTFLPLFLVFSITGFFGPCNGRFVEQEQEPSLVGDDWKGEGYLNDWVAEIHGGVERAKRVAAEHGFVVERQFMTIPDHYQLRHSDVPHRSKRSADHHTKRLTEDTRIKFAEQQYEKRRVKRGQRYNRDLAGHIARSTGDLDDPKYREQWYLEENASENHMRVKEAWKEGVTGKNVKVTIIDDGLERDHPDLALNYDPSASHDFNDNDADPMPRYEATNENKHGTRCGGEIAMVANNGNCGVGVAFNSKIGGVRMLDGKVTDRVEAESLGFTKNVDISSASWGPNDDGLTVEGPGTATQKGINESITLGRDGKGTIMVWAAGNGAHYGDNCNCDGYSSDHRTLSVSSASEHGLSPWYSEKCSSTLTATYSSGMHGDRKVISADIHGKCTTEHSGTSAAAPMAAGILALVLEKNPGLTWRDVQHLVVITSRQQPLAKEEGWYKNGIGLCVNHAFGFGLMDAYSLVKMAGEWKNVGPQKICRVEPNTESVNKKFTSGHSIEIDIETDGCHAQEQEVNYLEHVKVFLTLEASKRGNIYVELESPSGTITPLMVERENDKSTKGFQNWALTSVHNWGENPTGTWKVRIADRQSEDSENAELKDLKLELYGTREKPFYYDSFEKQDCGSLKNYPTMKEEEDVEEDPRYRMAHLFDNLSFD